MTARVEHSLAAQLDRMSRASNARASRAVLRDSHITLSHGAGGKASQALLDALILPSLGSPLLDGVADAGLVPLASGTSHMAFTTDSYVVSPLFFPGGDIGKLAVNGTINDLAVSGARPIALSLALILEEGLDIDTLRRVMVSIGEAAGAAGVPIATGDTKVVPRGKADRMFVNASGIGEMRSDVALSPASVRDGDVVIISGWIGDHGMAVMLAREALELESEIASDTTALHGLAAALLDAVPRTRVMKDPTRGGVATSLNEIARCAGVGITIEESRIPIRPEVHGACEILGIDPLHIANEGKLLAIVPPEDVERALSTLRGHRLGSDAAIIGEVRIEHAGMVILQTAIGGARVLDMLVGDPLPRIC